MAKQAAIVAGRAIIVFDAMCVLCSANAQFVLKHDRHQHFLIASMQEETGAGLYRKFGIDPSNPDTIVVVQGDMALRDSDAVLAIYYGLGWPWRLVGMLRIVPRPLRDVVYRWIAKHRYRMFGKRETCWLPSAEHAKRVI